MTAEQLVLDCEPDWDDAEFDIPTEPELPPDLRGQGLPYGARFTDITLTGSYL